MRKIKINYMEEINKLRCQYIELINVLLPSIAIDRQFPIRFNHCFARIILDNLFNGVWYDFITNRKISAYKQLDKFQLQQAIDIAQNMLDRPNTYVIDLNQKSLKWRLKL